MPSEQTKRTVYATAEQAAWHDSMQCHPSLSLSVHRAANPTVADALEPIKVQGARQHETFQGRRPVAKANTHRDGTIWPRRRSCTAAPKSHYALLIPGYEMDCTDMLHFATMRVEGCS